MAYTTIDDPSAYFKVQLWTGTGSSNAITFDDTDTDMQPDMVWIKVRSESNNHEVYDAVRGATERIYPDLSNAEDTNTAGLTAFGSDGFTVSTGHAVNKSDGTFVAWCWKESATAGFDIVTYTGSGSSADISHSLSAVPEMIFTKRRNDTQNWFIYTSTTGAQKSLFLDTNSAESTQAAAYDATPTSSVINYGDDNAVNGSSDTYVAYLWRSVQGFSKFGSYAANGDEDGPFVYTGFRPAFVINKRTDSTSGWDIFDNRRLGYNVANRLLGADGTGAESTTDKLDILSNGFKMRTDEGGNYSGGTYIYMAFAEAPLVNSNGVPCNAR